MIALNLLSPKQKEALRARVLYALVERVMIMLAFATICSGILLLGLRIRLTHALSNVQSRQLLSTEYVSVNSEIKKLNETIGRIERVQREVTPATILIVDMAGRTPPGILISSLSFETRTSALRISGAALTREALLSFEEALRKSPYLKTLESPISNLFEKRNINFQFQAILNTEALRMLIEPEPPQPSEAAGATPTP